MEAEKVGGTSAPDPNLVSDDTAEKLTKAIADAAFTEGDSKEVAQKNRRLRKSLRKRLKAISAVPSTRVEASTAGPKTKVKGTTKKAKNKFDPMSIGTGVKKNKSQAVAMGMATHTVKPGNDHDASAEQRRIEHVITVQSAVADALRIGARVVIAYGSYWEERLPDLYPDVDFAYFREAQYGFDSIKGLMISEPCATDAGTVIVMNDVYPPEPTFRLLFNKFSKGGRLKIHLARRSLGGYLGMDSTTAGDTAIWYRANLDSVECVYTLAVGSVTQYRDQYTDVILDRQSGMICPGSMSGGNIAFPLYFTSKNEHLTGTATFSGVIEMTGTPQPEIKVGFPPSRLGVIVDKNHLNQHILAEGYRQTFDNRSRVALNFAYSKKINDILGRQSDYIKAHPEMRAILDKSRVTTLQHEFMIDEPEIIMKQMNPRKDAELHSTQKRQEDIFGVFSHISAPFSTKMSLIETIEAFIRGFKIILMKAYHWAKAKIGGAKDALFGKSAEGLPDAELGQQPNNVIFNFGAFLSKVGDKLSGSSFKSLNKIGATIGFVTNSLKRPQGLSHISSATAVLSALVKILSCVGGVILERMMSYSGFTAALVALIDFMSIISTQLLDDEVLDTGKFATTALKGLFNVAVHVSLFFLPFWLALPIHLTYDFFATKTFEELKIIFHRVPDALRETLQFVKSQTLLKDLGRLRHEDGKLLLDDHIEMVEMTNPHVALPVSGAQLLNSTLKTSHGKTKNPTIAHVMHYVQLILGDRYTNLERGLVPGVVPLVGSRSLRGCSLTQNSIMTGLTALFYRYSALAIDTSEVWANFERARDALQRVNPIQPSDAIATQPYGEKRFAEHISTWPKGKKMAYTTVGDELDAGILSECDTASEVAAAGKTNEILTIKFNDKGEPYLKGRFVYPFGAQSHAPFLKAALGIKRGIVARINRTRIERFGFVITFFVPIKGTAQELDSRASAIVVGEICFFESGDDGFILWRRNRHQLLVSAGDLGSCDITVRKAAQTSNGILWTSMGANKDLLSLMRKTANCKKVIKIRPGKNSTLREMADLRINVKDINTSGMGTTTAENLTVMFQANSLTVDTWNGDPWTLIKHQKDTYTSLGLNLKLESSPGQAELEWAEASRRTFLSRVCVLMPSEDNVNDVHFVPFSCAKSLMIKGKSVAAKGNDFIVAVAARSADPKLQIRPTHRMIASKMRQFAVAHGVDPDDEYAKMIKRDPTARYKLNGGTDFRMSEAQELHWLHSAFGISPEEYAHDCQEIDNMSEFPNRVELKILNVMSNHHYGYSAMPP